MRGRERERQKWNDSKGLCFAGCAGFVEGGITAACCDRDRRIQTFLPHDSLRRTRDCQRSFPQPLWLRPCPLQPRHPRSKIENANKFDSVPMLEATVSKCIPAANVLDSGIYCTCNGSTPHQHPPPTTEPINAPSLATVESKLTRRFGKKNFWSNSGQGADLTAEQPSEAP